MNDRTHEFFDLSHDSGVAHLRLNRPERLNTMAPAFFPALRDAVRRLGETGETRVLVVSSTGKHFSGRHGARGLRRRRRDARHFIGATAARLPGVAAKAHGLLQRPRRSTLSGDRRDPGRLHRRRPRLVTACDIRLCSADAFFLLQEINVGMAADLGSLQRLPKIVPEGVAREMAYSGERLGADRRAGGRSGQRGAARCRGAARPAMTLARSIAAKSPLAIAGSKLALNHARDHGTAASLQQMTLLQSAIFDTGEMATAIAAWKEKRAAEFAALAPATPV
jgi:enoyl-CoA hydratase